jgi:hypothetical protein
VNVPLASVGGVGLGVGGTQHIKGAVAITMKHAPWTVGAPPNPTGGGVFTIHSPDSNVTQPALPSGIATPASNTAVNSGVLQLVTVSKVYTSLTGAFPELPVIAVLNLHFAPEPGNLLLLVSGAGGIMLAGGLRGRRSARRKALLGLLALLALGIVALLATSAMAGRRPTSPRATATAPSHSTRRRDRLPPPGPPQRLLPRPRRRPHRDPLLPPGPPQRLLPRPRRRPHRDPLLRRGRPERRLPRRRRPRLRLPRQRLLPHRRRGPRERSRCARLGRAGSRRPIW